MFIFRGDNKPNDHPDLTVTDYSNPVTTPTHITRTEHRVLRQLAQGKSNKVIALELAYSEHTIAYRVSNLLSKTGARNRTELAAKYLRREI